MRGVRSRTVLVLAAISLLGVALIVAGDAAQSELYSVTLATDKSFDWRAYGYIEFRVISSGTISTRAGTINLNSGDVVKVVVNAVNVGGITVDKNVNNGKHYITLSSLPVEAIYVNSQLVASSTYIDRTLGDGDRLYIDLSSLKSTLRVEVTLKQGANYGWAWLTVNGNTLVSSQSYRGYFIVYGATATSSKRLVVNLGGTYFDGAAEGVELVDSSGSVQIIGVPEADIWGLAAAAPIVAAFALRSRRYSWSKR